MKRRLAQEPWDEVYWRGDCIDTLWIECVTVRETTRIDWIMILSRTMTMTIAAGSTRTSYPSTAQHSRRPSPSNTSSAADRSPFTTHATRKQHKEAHTTSNKASNTATLVSSDVVPSLVHPPPFPFPCNPCTTSDEYLPSVDYHRTSYGSGRPKLA